MTFLLATLFSSAVWAQDRPISFQQQILPILERRCHACHQSANAGGQLNLTSYSQIFAKAANRERFSSLASQKTA